MHTHWLAHPTPYTGAELAPHWIYRQTGQVGDAVLAFVGEARVHPEGMVDCEDARAGAAIYSPRMLHFLIEVFQEPLVTGVVLQRLFMALLAERLSHAKGLARRGDDLWLGEGKLSVSIATVSPTSVLIHTGLNLETAGTPVPTAGLLTDLGWSEAMVVDFANEAMAALAGEWRGIQHAACKVRGVV